MVGRESVNHSAVVIECHVQVSLCKGDSRELFGDMGGFGVWCFEEISFLDVKVEDVLFFDEAWIKKGLIIDEGVKITERAATIEGRSPVPWDI